jgi:osmotically-inducible protein OsmY
MVVALAQGCVNTAVTGAQMTYNQHSLSNTLNDHYISMQADRALHWKSTHFKESNVAVYTFNRVSVITGQVPTRELQQEATRIVKEIPDVQEVYNLTTVSSTASSLVHISDAWITTKITAQMIAENGIDPNQFKVITENGTVYLMGIVFPDQANAATEIAKNTDGVQSVVRVFSYLKISKTLES